MRYRLVTGASHTLEERVAGLISEGWKPLGGVSMSLDENGVPHFAQAMTRPIPGVPE
ncbi:DUF1737 domain-containing protein [Roseivivax marinus]|uniref:DUF1737 domain-containing protein n=1 Tax=Roseivivax marinus TaxID=1379903 RepID=UPI003B97A0D5